MPSSPLSSPIFVFVSYPASTARVPEPRAAQPAAPRAPAAAVVVVLGGVVALVGRIHWGNPGRGRHPAAQGEVDGAYHHDHSDSIQDRYPSARV